MAKKKKQKTSGSNVAKRCIKVVLSGRAPEGDDHKKKKGKKKPAKASKGKPTKKKKDNVQ